jgi:hypothetical protein
MMAADALGEIGDPSAVEPLIGALEDDFDSEVRESAADALGMIGAPRAVEPLIGVLENDSDSDVRRLVADALGKIGDARAVGPLVTALENDSDSNVRLCSAAALAGFECDRVRDALKAARDRKNKCAAIALAWQIGGDELESAGKLEVINELPLRILVYARARWGDMSAVEEIIFEQPYLFYFIPRFRADVFSRMPAGFPEYDFKANYATREKQAETVKAWYEKNKDRLAWDAKARKYFRVSREGKSVQRDKGPPGQKPETP